MPKLSLPEYSSNHHQCTLAIKFPIYVKPVKLSDQANWNNNGIAISMIMDCEFVIERKKEKNTKVFKEAKMV